MFKYSNVQERKKEMLKKERKEGRKILMFLTSSKTRSKAGMYTVLGKYFREVCRLL